MLSMSTIINDNTVISTIKEKNNKCKENEVTVNNIFMNIISDLTNIYGIDSLYINGNNITLETSSETTLDNITNFVKSHFTGYEELFKHICGINLIKGSDNNIFNIWRKK